jgi:cobalt-zinc-cadmium efflux system outer membrane protein
VVTLAVAVVFFDVLAASERTRLTEENQRLAQDLLELARTRIAKGAEPPIVLNSARIRLAEARRKTLDARAEAAAATVRLARVLGMPPGTSLALAGKLPAEGGMQPSDDLIEEGLANRPDVLALSRRVGAAQAAVRLADAAAWPELRLGIHYGLDQEDRLVLGTVGIALPVFARNQGERERNRAAALRAETELNGLRLGVESEIREAKARFDAAAAALTLYDAEVLRAQEENLVLIRTTYEAGKTDFTQMVLLERELLEGRLGFLDARLALASAEATLRAAAGLDVAETGQFQGGKP